MSAFAFRAAGAGNPLGSLTEAALRDFFGTTPRFPGPARSSGWACAGCQGTERRTVPAEAGGTREVCAACGSASFTPVYAPEPDPMPADPFNGLSEPAIAQVAMIDAVREAGLPESSALLYVACLVQVGLAIQRSGLFPPPEP